VYGDICMLHSTPRKRVRDTSCVLSLGRHIRKLVRPIIALEWMARVIDSDG